MKRRKVLALLAGAAVSPSIPARAAGDLTKTFRLAVLSTNPPGGRGYFAFLQQLHLLGHEEGRNLQIDYVQLDIADTDHARAMTALVGRGVDVIFAAGPELAVKSAVEATRTVPIVMLAADYDPIERGYVAGLARPGGNVTGVFVQPLELIGKRLEFLSRTVPELARVVVLWDRISVDQLSTAQQAARTLRIPLDGIECTDSPYDYERPLAGIDGARRDVLLQLVSPLFFQDRQRLAAVALAHRLPSMFAFRQWVDEGGLMSYSASLTDMSRLAADYVDPIAKGAKPEDLPVQQPTRFELVVNLKTAQALGLTIRAAILARADEIIE